MTAARAYVIWCNNHDRPYCPAEFKPPAGMRYDPLEALRREAAKQGWTHVRHSRDHSLDSDFCPDHKPAKEADR